MGGLGALARNASALAADREVPATRAGAMAERLCVPVHDASIPAIGEAEVNDFSVLRKAERSGPWARRLRHTVFTQGRGEGDRGGLLELGQVRLGRDEALELGIAGQVSRCERVTRTVGRFLEPTQAFCSDLAVRIVPGAPSLVRRIGRPGSLRLRHCPLKYAFV